MIGAIVLCVVFGLFTLLLALSRWLAGRPWAAAGNVLLGIALLTVAQIAWPPVLHLRTYDRIPARGLVAQVVCERTGPRSYRVTLTRLPAGRMQVFEVSGDEWRLDARTLTFSARATTLGLHPNYRLDRLSARYLAPITPADAETQGDPPTAVAPAPAPTSYPLDDRDEAGEDLWAQVRTGSRWQADVEARHASGPWRPLAQGARFDVWMTRDGAAPGARIDALPANEAASKAMRYTPAKAVRGQG